jgi:membrane protein
MPIAIPTPTPKKVVVSKTNFKTKTLNMGRILKYFNDDIWKVNVQKTSGIKKLYLTFLRVIFLSFRGFSDGKCFLHASALTYYTLLSIVPVVAMFFGIARGFGFEDNLRERLLDEFSQQHEAVVYIIGFAGSLIENTKSGAIAGVGVLALLYTIIKLLGNIEDSFNNIWKTAAQRSLARKFSDYISVVIIAPALIILSGSITVFLNTKISSLLTAHGAAIYLAILFFLVLKLVSYIIPCLLMAFIYIFIPNTKVRLKSAVTAGVSAGIIYQILQWLYIKLQVELTGYDAIYGSFAALPLFLVWLQLSWLVLLFGVEISCAFQTADLYEHGAMPAKNNNKKTKAISLRIASLISKAFKAGIRISDAEISEKTRIPLMTVRQIAGQLCQSGIIVEHYENKSEDIQYLPAIDIRNLTVSYILNKIDGNETDVPDEADQDMKKIIMTMNDIEKSAEDSKSNVLIEDL